MKISFHLALLPTLIIASFPVAAADTQDNGEHYTATLPTVSVVGQSDTSVLKGYINYDEAAVTRNGQLIKETPQTIDTLNIQKNKNYGTNDLSSILEGNAGIDAAYDMRGESIFLRGFQADASDIYRDGVRESGQVRRSTANIERVEILKGPSSVLYGRTNGGGVINMVSKYANFKQSRNIGAVYGSWANRSLNMDINEVLNKNVAIRLTGEVGRANSFRSGIDSAQHYRQTRQRLEVDGAIHLRQCGAHARPQSDQVRVRPLRTALPHGVRPPERFCQRQAASLALRP